MKGIGIFVLLFLVGVGVAMFVYTRPPDRDLAAEERAWVDRFSAWRADYAGRIERAEVEIGVSRGERLSTELVEPLRTCSPSLEEVGAPPTLLAGVVDEAARACGEVAYALSVHARFGRPALATTKQHLHRAGTLLTAAEIHLQRELDTSGS